MGPWNAAKDFLTLIKNDRGSLAGVVKIEAELFGSLAKTGKGHGTDKSIMMGLMGVQMVDLENGEIHMNDWVRGTCQFGVMPANGMLYVPPDSCAWAW